MSSAVQLPADARICGTCAFWQPGRIIPALEGASTGSWPGLCPRLCEVRRVNQSCPLWSAPDPDPLLSPSHLC